MQGCQSHSHERHPWLAPTLGPSGKESGTFPAVIGRRASAALNLDAFVSPTSNLILPVLMLSCTWFRREHPIHAITCGSLVLFVHAQPHGIWRDH